MVNGRDDWGISRAKIEGAPIRLIVYPEAHHAFDVPRITPSELFGHRLEFNKAAADQAAAALREFLHAMLGAGP